MCTRPFNCWSPTIADRGIAQRDRAAGRENHGERQRADQHQCRHDRAAGEPSEPLADQSGHLLDADVAETGVPCPQRGRQIERPHVVGRAPVGQQILQVLSLAFDLGQLDLELVRSTSVAGIHHRDRDISDHDDRYEQWFDGHQDHDHTHRHDRCRENRDETEDDGRRLLAGRIDGTVETIEELRPFELLDLDLRGGLEDLIHRRAVHPFTQRKP